MVQVHRMCIGDTVDVPRVIIAACTGRQEAKGLSASIRQVRGHRLVAIFHCAPMPFLA